MSRRFIESPIRATGAGAWIVTAFIAIVLVVAARDARAQDEPVSAPPSSAPKRPVIGIALGGGSARGMAHAGVLRWLEEHHIPIDRIAGNSTGAFMSAAYATGMSSAEIRSMLRLADWQTILRPDIAYPLRSYRRKEDDRDFSIKLEAGLRHGFRLQSGLNPGHYLGMLVSRVLLPYSDVSNFDDL
ncbi:MAG: patatin-like phospholipase family protein, partial [Vicinamibacteria bacterium]